MRCFRFLLVFAGLFTLTVGVDTAVPPWSSAASTAAARSRTADNGNGTCSNPLFNEEFEDPDIVRVGEVYYLACATMHMNPALIVLHSRALVNWEPARCCMDRLDLGCAFRLEGGTIQELQGHSDVSTTMIYRHVFDRGGRGVLSPADSR